jgi:hypothetical protein
LRVLLAKRIGFDEDSQISAGETLLANLSRRPRRESRYRLLDFSPGG